MNMKKNEAQQSMSNDARVAVLETAFININSTLLDIRRAFDKMESKFESKLDAMDKKFESKLDAMDKKFDAKFDILQNRLWSNFLWLMSMIIGLAGLIAHTQHWL